MKAWEFCEAMGFWLYIDENIAEIFHKSKDERITYFFITEDDTLESNMQYAAGLIFDKIGDILAGSM